MKFLPFIAALLAAPAALAQETESLRYTCADGRVVDIAFPDAETAVLEIDGGEPVGLALIPAGDVAAGESEEVAEQEEAAAEAGGVDRPRYAGNGYQWIADGTAQGTLSAEGDPSDPGVVCTEAEDASE